MSILHRGTFGRDAVRPIAWDILSLVPLVPVQLYVGIKIGRPDGQKKHLHSN